MSFHRERLRRTLMELSATFLTRAASPQSLITVNDCELSADNRLAKITVSVFPPEQGTAAMGFLRRRREDLRDYLKERLRVGRLPRLRFVLTGPDVKIEPELK